MQVPLTIRDFLDRAATVYPERTAFTDEPDQPGPSWGSVTYGEMARRAAAQAAALDRLGVGPGERVAIVSHNSARLLTSFFGVSGWGRILVPVNFRLAAEEVRYIVEHSGASVLLVDPELEDQLSGVTAPHRFTIGDEADAALRTADAAVDLAQARLDKRRLLAPFDAWSGLRNVSPGDFVTTDTRIVNLEQTDPLKVDFRVPELFLPAVAKGQRITLEIDAYPGEAFVGTVRALDPLIDATGRALVVRAEIANDEEKLRPGLFARVRLTLAERQSALFVPEQAIQPQGDKAFVFRVMAGGDGKSVARLTPVVLGARRGGEVEVMQGLAPGDVVVDAGLLKIRDGVPVQILPAAGATVPEAARNRPATG